MREAGKPILRDLLLGKKVSGCHYDFKVNALVNNYPTPDFRKALSEIRDMFYMDGVYLICQDVYYANDRRHYREHWILNDDHMMKARMHFGHLVFTEEELKNL